jgi:hypothetical protein
MILIFPSSSNFEPIHHIEQTIWDSSLQTNLLLSSSETRLSVCTLNYMHIFMSANVQPTTMTSGPRTAINPKMEPSSRVSKQVGTQLLRSSRMAKNSPEIWSSGLRIVEAIIGSLNMGSGRVRRLLGALDILRRISRNSRKRNIMMRSSEYLIQSEDIRLMPRPARIDTYGRGL